MIAGTFWSVAPSKMDWGVAVDRFLLSKLFLPKSKLFTDSKFVFLDYLCVSDVDYLSWTRTSGRSGSKILAGNCEPWLSGIWDLADIISCYCLLIVDVASRNFSWNVISTRWDLCMKLSKFIYMEASKCSIYWASIFSRVPDPEFNLWLPLVIFVDGLSFSVNFPFTLLTAISNAFIPTTSLKRSRTYFMHECLPSVSG